MKNIKALVVSGGGMRCAYSAGAVYALAKKYKIHDFHIVIGGSGCTGTLSYYMSEQYESIKNIWKNLLCTKRFIDMFRISKIIDVDYLIDNIFKKQDVLNELKIYSSKTLYLISSTNYKTGKVEYFSNRDKINVFDAMRASMAMPVIYGKIINLKGKEYCDTPNSNSVETNIKRAIELGANKILVIDNGNLDYPTKLGFKLWLLSRKINFRKNYYNELKKIKNIILPKYVRLFYLKPNKKFGMGLLDNKKGRLTKIFDIGYNETFHNQKLKKFLRY
jgi:predicted patatin/cPLA2 family phospholipase